MKKEILAIVMLPLFVTSFCFANGPDDFNNNANQAMPSGNPNYFTPASASIQLLSAPPTKPPDNVATTTITLNYYKDYIVYIKTVTNPVEKAQAWKVLLNDFASTMTKNPNAIDSFTTNYLLSQAKAFLDSPEFSMLSKNGQVEHVSTLIDTLKTAISTKHTDAGVVANTMFRIEGFLGTTVADPRNVLSGLSNAQQATLLASFKELTIEIMKADSDSASSVTKARAIGGLVRLLTAALQAPGSDNLTQASTEILNLVADYVKSAEFKGLQPEQQNGLTWNLSQAAKVLIGNAANDAASKDLIAKVTETFNTLITTGTPHVQALAINELLGLVDLASQNNNKELVSNLLTNQISNGIISITDNLIARISNSGTATPNEERGDEANALSSILLHANAINKAGGGDQFINSDKIMGTISNYLYALNNGYFVNTNPAVKDALLNRVGLFIGDIVTKGQQNGPLTSYLIDTYLITAEKALSLSPIATNDGGSLDPRLSAINALKYIKDIATAKGDTALVDKINKIKIS